MEKERDSQALRAEESTTMARNETPQHTIAHTTATHYCNTLPQHMACNKIPQHTTATHYCKTDLRAFKAEASTTIAWELSP